MEDLASDHEEADTKLVAMSFSRHIIAENLMVRSPSGDIDILVLFLLHQCSHVFIDNGTGSNRRILDMSTTGLGNLEKEAVVGLHSFSGNDYVSSFFKMGKQKMWKKVKSKVTYFELFASFGNKELLSQATLNQIETFVCDIYGYSKLSSVDMVRKEMFLRKCQKLGKSVELASLPPCKSNLEHHTRRAHYVARLFRSSFKVMMTLTNPNTHGWDNDGSPVWTNCYVPEDLNELLCDCEEINLDSSTDNEDDDDASSTDERESDEF